MAHAGAVAACVLAATGLVVPLASMPAVAVAPSAPMSSALVVAAASPASDAYAAARSLRRDVATMLQDYLTNYGDRYTPTERRQLAGYRAKADRELAAVVAATQRLNTAVIARAPLAQRRAAGTAAQSAWRRAKATADSSFESARRILEPRLSIIERLRAARDYNTMMGRFDELGTQVDVAAAQ